MIASWLVIHILFFQELNLLYNSDSEFNNLFFKHHHPFSVTALLFTFFKTDWKWFCDSRKFSSIPLKYLGTSQSSVNLRFPKTDVLFHRKSGTKNFRNWQTLETHCSKHESNVHLPIMHIILSTYQISITLLQSIWFVIHLNKKTVEQRAIFD